MKGIITGLLLSVVPHVLVSALGATGAYADEPGAKENVYVVRATGVAGGEEGNPIVITTEGGGNMVWTSKDGGNTVWTSVGEDDGRSDAKHGVVRIERKLDAEEANRGWLGVMISDTRTEGDEESSVVAITKVLEGSPAEDAGLLDGDVIVSINGELVEGNVSRSVELIKSHEAGDKVDIVVLRDGAEKTLVATLGSRADSAAATVELKLDDALQGAIEDRIVTRGKMLKRDDDGNWVVTELGDLNEIPDLPDNVRMFIPKAGSSVIELKGDGESRTMTININRDGETVSIKQEDGGDIVVTRVDADGVKTENSYADEAELQAADAEAYELYSKSGKQGTLQFYGHATDLDDEDFDFDAGGNNFIFKFDTGDFEDHMLEWKEKLEESLDGADAHYEAALEKVQELLERLDEGEGLPAMERLQQFRPLHMPKLDGAQAFAMHFGKPAYSFEVRPDGTIAATLRKGDTEVVQLFTDENDLADRKPDLYEKYKKLTDTE